MADKPVVWISRRISDASLARAERDYNFLINH